MGKGETPRTPVLAEKTAAKMRTERSWGRRKPGVGAKALQGTQRLKASRKQDCLVPEFPSNLAVKDLVSPLLLRSLLW